MDSASLLYLELFLELYLYSYRSWCEQASSLSPTASFSSMLNSKWRLTLYDNAMFNVKTVLSLSFQMITNLS